MDALNASADSEFIFTVTAQGHGKYPTDFAESPITVLETEQLEFGDPEALEYYLYQLGETDRFIGDLIHRLEDYPEDVVLVLYGDHLPALGIAPELHETGSLYNTDYIIWNNFGMKGADADLPAYQLTAHVLELLDLHEGTVFQYHQSYKDQETYLAGLEMLEYDMIFGERFISGGMNPLSPSNLHMGLHDVTLSKVRLDNETTVAEGTGFTPFSVIYINGHRRDTTYVNSGLLYADHPIQEGDTVSVCQTGDDNVPLSATRAYTVTPSDLIPKSDQPPLPYLP
jgi:hypothetical protein